jgi:hypothetical protein
MRKTKEAKKKERNEILICFLYTLLRDRLSSGAVEILTQDAEKIKGKHPVIYSNKHIERYAVEIAERLLFEEER